MRQSHQELTPSRQKHERAKLERALWNAAMRNNADEVEKLLDETPELLHVLGHRGQCLLASAVFSDNKDWVVALVRRGAHHNTAEADGRTPLHIVAGAAGNCHHPHAIGIAELLLTAGANPNLRAEGGMTPLARAVQQGSVEMVRVLLHGGADPTIVNDQGNTPLVMAIMHRDAKMRRDVEMVRALSEDGRGLEVRNARGETPLALAIRYSTDECVQILLDAGCDPNARSANEMPVLFAAPILSTKVMRLLQEHGYDMARRGPDGRTLLAQAVRYGDTDAVCYIFDYTEDVNASDAFGSTPMHEAASQGDVAVAALLADRGASVTVVDIEDRTPLHRCVLGSAALDMIRWLADAGCDLDARNAAGETPLRVAITKRKAEAAALLLELGATL